MTERGSRAEVDLVVSDIDWLITVDDTRRVIRNGAVAVKDGRFVEVGATDAVLAAVTPRERIRADGRVGTPGLVDCHLHSSFQLSRGLADEVNAKAFLFSRMYPYEGAMEDEDVFHSARLAAWELLRHGVTCFSDPGNYSPRSTVAACQELGIRVVISHSTFDQPASVLGVLPEKMISTTDQALAQTAELLDEFSGPIDRGVSASASFRGLNNSSDDLIRGLHVLAEEHGTFLQCHACFSYSTHDASVAQHGVSEVNRILNLGLLDERVVIIHAGWLEPREVRAVVENRPNLVLAPTSSFHNGYGNITVGFVPELLEFGVKIGLGSDHASSGAVDMTREMFLAAGGYKERRLNPKIMSPESVLEMGTRTGAEVLGFGQDLGSVEVGKLADLVLFDATRPEWLPLYNPVANLIYSASGATVDSVFVGGRRVIESGRLTSADEAEIRSETAKTGARIFSRVAGDLSLTPWPVLEGGR